MISLHKIDFTVPLSGSQLFDMSAYDTARRLCASFPGLSFTYNHERIHITGELNDEWYELYHRHLFGLEEENA